MAGLSQIEGGSNIKGLIFRSEMVLALPKGKTETRRIEKSLEGINLEPDKWQLFGGQLADKSAFAFYFDANTPLKFVKPRYRVGETVYVKETFSTHPAHYKADGYTLLAGEGQWHSPLMMPSWAARTFLKILSATPVRLKTMTEQDARAEGFNSLAEFVPYFDQIHPGAWERNEWAIDYVFQKVDRLKDASEVTGIWDFTGGDSPVEHIRRMRDD